MLPAVCPVSSKQEEEEVQDFNLNLTSYECPLTNSMCSDKQLSHKKKKEEDKYSRIYCIHQKHQITAPEKQTYNKQ